MSRFVEIPQIISLNGGSIVGKTRIQKTFYFLESLGVGVGLDFQYYHYGPYSEELSTDIEDSVALGLVTEKWQKSAAGYPYARLEASCDHSDDDAALANKRRAILETLEKYDSISLELAATADFLERSGYTDFWKETEIRKASKASPGRVEKAKQLLNDLSNLSA